VEVAGFEPTTSTLSTQNFMRPTAISLAL
jgi:hypothetical protein